MRSRPALRKALDAERGVQGDQCGDTGREPPVVERGKLSQEERSKRGQTGREEGVGAGIPAADSDPVEEQHENAHARTLRAGRQRFGTALVVARTRSAQAFSMAAYSSARTAFKTVCTERIPLNSR